MMRLRNIGPRLARLEAATHKAAIAAMDNVCPAIENRRQGEALWACVLAALGQGPEPDAETRYLARKAAAAMWTAASPSEKRLLWALLPLPRVE
jgi:hypothetical protein